MRRSLLLLPLLGVALLVQSMPALFGGNRESIPLGNGPAGQYWANDGWQFNSGDGASDSQLQSGEGQGWQAVSLPHTWNQGDLSPSSMRGKRGWYRLHLDGLDQASQTRWIAFDGIAGRSQFWLDGRKLASSDIPGLPIKLQLGDLRPGGNLLVVQVDNRRNSLALPPAKQGKDGSEFGDGWWNWGGIVRGVRMWSVWHTHIDHPAVHTILTAGDAKIEVKATFSNPGRQQKNLTVEASLDGKQLGVKTLALTPGANGQLVWQASLQNPHLWSPQDPHLVPLAFSASDGTHIDRWLGQTGLRSIQVHSGHMLLNGKPLKLWGVNLHEHNPDGWASSKQDQDQILAQALSVGGNMIRAHYALSDYIMQRADQLGLLVWSEIPVWQPNRTAMASSLFRQRAAQALKSTILSNRDHPSVLAWSIGNEYQVYDRSPGLEEWTNQAKQIADQLDPDTPLAVAVQPGQIGFRAWRPLDLIGVNAYVGWYYGSLGSLPGLMRLWRTKTPSAQAMIVSEFGAEATASSQSSRTRGSLGYQAQLLGDTVGIISRDKSWDGGAVWVLRDFACRPGWTGKNPLHPNPPFNNKGLFYADGQAKPARDVVGRWYRRLLAGKS